MSTGNILAGTDQEKDKETVELVRRIKRLCTNLDAGDLKIAELDSLKRDIVCLIEVAKERATRDRRIEELRARLQDWRQDNSEALATTPAKLKETLEKLEERVVTDALDQETLNIGLDECNKALNLHKSLIDLQKDLEQANREENFNQVASLSSELSSLKDKRDEICEQVVASFSDPSEGSPTLEASQAEESADITALTVKGHGQRKDDAEISQPSPHQEAVTRLEPKIRDISQSIPSKRHIDRSLPDESKNRSSNEEPSEEQGKDHGSRDEVLALISVASEQPVRIDTTSAGVSSNDIEEGIAKALERDRFGVAYHLAYRNPDTLLDSDTVKLIAANYVTDDTAPVSAELHNVANSLLSKAKTTLHEKQTLMPVLIVSAALSPALIAPGGPVAQLLSFVEPHLGDMSALRVLVQTTADVSRTGVSLSVELLQGGISQEDWNARASALQREGGGWIRDEYQAKIRFAPATAVWRRIVEEWKEERCASIGYMFKLLTKPPNEINIKEVSQIAEYWRRNPESEIDRIDRSRRESSKKRIEGPSRSSLFDKIEKAISFADRWDELLKARPDKRSTFQTEQAEKLRTAVRNHGEAALEEISGLSAVIAPKSKELVRRFIDNLSDSQMEPPTSHLRLEDLLNGDLLVDPDIPLPYDKEDQETVGVVPLLRLAEQDKFDFQNAIIERVKRGDFRGAEYAFDLADRRGSLDEDSNNRIRSQIEHERNQVVESLTTRIDKANNQLDAAYARGILTAAEVDQWRLNTSLNDLAEDDNLTPYRKRLEEIDEAVTDAKQKRRDEMRQQLESLPHMSEEDRKRIWSAIQDSRFQVAEDYIERVQTEKSLPQVTVETKRPFDDFFPDFVKNYVSFRDQTEGTLEALSLIQSALENGESAGPVNAEHLSKDAYYDSARLFRAWSELYTKISNEKLREFISTLGFRGVKLSPKNQTIANRQIVRRLLEVEPIADRRIAQLPDFGSRAAGRYQLIVVRGYETEEAIIQEIEKRKLDGQPPIIVVFLNMLDTEARRELARSLVSNDLHPTLVLDEALVAFLTTRPNSRLASFFDCASAFTLAQPFDPDATEVPPEMFFGRKKEREKILNMSGDMTHLVYGGRRLGKTAVLMDIAREYRSQSKRKVVLFLSLKGSGIGEKRQTDELWRMFAKQLAEYNIVPTNTIRYESIKIKIQDWLTEDKERRILFLVDEADAFLDAERKPEQAYRVLEQIKHLMEETRRHFKVVFAGLHNVQRAARDPNTPFAHLGEPVRIGPMLPDSDGDEVENLIRAPLETLGYRFSSSDSVVRIAAETNYYPALVQQFCKELLRDLRENNSQSELPYTVGPEVVDRVFDSKETRGRIRNLFNWTIQLDPRYEFLTYLIAQQSFDNDNSWPRSVPIDEIRTAALREWRQGFDSDPSFWTFQVLLEEMVGLGILREVQGEGFAIRTRNLRMLLGNDDEIKQRFADAKAKTLPPTFDPSQSRRTLKDERISSLSAGLEERLVSNKQWVGLIFGTRLAGLDRIRESFEQLAKREEFSVTVHGPFSTYERQTLRSATRSRKHGTHIVLVDMYNSDWRRDWVEKALDSVSELDARNRTIRPVFICTPTHAWKRLNEADPACEGNVELWEIWLGPCAKGFAHTWLKEREAPAYTDLESQDHSVDAPWPMVVETSAGERRPQSMREAADFTLDDQELVADVLDMPETISALRGLSEFGPITADELSNVSPDLGDKLSLEQAERILHWASRLGVVQRDDKGYRLDTAYAIGVKRFLKE